MFESLWKNFENGFNTILESLARHKELVENEARTIDLVEARNWRLRAQQDVEEREKRRRGFQLQEAKTWLGAEDHLQEDVLDRLIQSRQEGTCDWVLENPQFRSWKDVTSNRTVLWLKGIPGAGLYHHPYAILKSNGLVNDLYQVKVCCHRTLFKT